LFVPAKLESEKAIAHLNPLEQNAPLPVDEELKRKLATLDFCRPTLRPSDVVKKIKHKRTVVKKELPKSASNCKKERSAKVKKLYIEDDDQEVEEIESTGSRNWFKCIKRISTIN
jgi:hypothetical protein